MEWRNLAPRAEVQPQARLNQEVRLNYTGHQKFCNLGNIEVIKPKCDIVDTCWGMSGFGHQYCVYCLFPPPPHSYSVFTLESRPVSLEIHFWFFLQGLSKLAPTPLKAWRVIEKKFLNIYLVSSFCDCVCVVMHVFISRSEDSVVKLVLSFHHVNSEGQTQVLKSKDQEQGPRTPQQQGPLSPEPFCWLYLVTGKWIYVCAVILAASWQRLW